MELPKLAGCQRYTLAWKPIRTWFMREFVAVILALLASALAPALAFTVPLALAALFFPSFLDKGLLALFVATFFVSLGFSGSLGLIAVALLLRVSKFRMLPMLLSGIVIGTVPMSLMMDLEWPGSLKLLATSGILGAIGSMAFYFVYRRISHHPSVRSSQLGGPN